MLLRKNCWEYWKCGREPGGRNVDTLGVCPASTHIQSDGTNGGKNAGRCCWVVAGTLCDDEVDGVFAEKFENCLKCPFYLAVERQEGRFFALFANRRSAGKETRVPKGPHHATDCLMKVLEQAEGRDDG